MSNNWREAVKAATEILALGLMAVGLLAALGAATFFWQMVAVAR